MKALGALLGVAALVLGAAQTQAGTIFVSNTVPPGRMGLTQKIVVLSDLTVLTDNPLVPMVVILRSNDATDDVTLKTGEGFTRTIPQNITGYRVSETVNGREMPSTYLGLRTRFENRVAFLDDQQGNPLLLTASLDTYQDPPPEGSILVFTNGTTPSRPDWFVQTIDSLENPVAPFTGSATIVDESFLVDVVPEPSTLSLAVSGVVTLVGFGWHRAFRRRAGNK